MRTVCIVRITLVLTTGRGLSGIHVRTTPLAQLQNFQGPVKSTRSKIGAVVPTPSEPSSQLSKKAARTKRHGPSPPKRVRLRPAEAKRAAYALDCDADDENILSARIELRHTMQTPTQMPIKEAQVCHLQTTKSHKNLWKSSPRVQLVSSLIKANAEIQAATQVKQERNMSLLGLTDDGSDFSGVPKMESPESDTCQRVKR
ncbi:hypothetical protein BU17DRAFT_83663 [Hysterangium stoloniferum]|nr:hypothetical protein BU17DRAFT_83663 [Hysterangium stoloniferum]